MIAFVSEGRSQEKEQIDLSLYCTVYLNVNKELIS